MCAKSHRVSSHVSFLFRPKSKSTSLWKSWKVDFWKEHVKCRFSKTCHDNERNGKPCLTFFFFFVYMYQFKRILRTIAIKNWLPALISANSRHSSQQVLHKTSGCSKINLFYIAVAWKLFSVRKGGNLQYCTFVHVHTIHVIYKFVRYICSKHSIQFTYRLCTAKIVHTYRTDKIYILIQDCLELPS